MAKNRFKKVYSQGGSERIKIYVDTPYIIPLLDKDGKPVVTPVND